MRVNIVTIGNSKGIRIPKSILTQCHFNKEANLEVEGNKLIIKPIKKKAREGWDSALRLMRERNEDALLLDDSMDLDMKDWKW